jgi:poly-gamma-glutamate synthesis protein (capsule biosynthesis protein)
MLKIGFFSDTILRKGIKIPSKLKKKLQSNDFNCLNLEAPFVLSKKGFKHDRCRVFSDRDKIGFLKKYNFKFVNLANNHLLDFGKEGLLYTKKLLKENSISFFGAGESIEEAQKPIVFSFNRKLFAFFGFGWDFTSAIYANKKRAGVAPLEPELVKESLARYKDIDYKIAYFHFGTEYEDYPEPIHLDLVDSLFREKLINLVIGTHPHCIQGFKRYKNGSAFFSLGNFLMPEMFYCGGSLNFLNKSHIGYFVEADFNENSQFTIHPYRLSKDSKEVVFPVKDSSCIYNKINKYSYPLSKNYEEYRRFYLQNRTRKFRPCFTKSIIRNRIQKSLYLFFVGIKLKLGIVKRKLMKKINKKE